MTCEVCAGPTVPLQLDATNALSQCVRCGHLLRDPDRAPAGHRDQAYGGEPALDKARLALTYRSLRRHSRPASVFEVGFGTGAMLRHFLDDGAAVAGADPDQLGLAVDPVVAAHGRLVRAPMEQIDPDAFDVDLVFGVHVLEHVVDPMRTLELAFDLLRPGGQVQFFTPAGDSDGLRHFGADWWMLEDPTHVRFFTARSAQRAAEKAGFVDVQVDRPVLDSITTDAGSLARRITRARGRAPRSRGALDSTVVLAAAAVTGPLVVAGRALRAGLRPTLQLIARRPAS